MNEQASVCVKCGQETAKDRFCSGCKTLICDDCNLNETVSGFGHSADDHLRGSECCDARIDIDYTCFDCDEPV